jgi:hypothetical protein
MISPRRRQLLIGLVLTLVCLPALGQEPNEAKTELKFESNDKEQPWIIEIDANGNETIETRKEMIRGSFQPKYVAVFYVRDKRDDMSHYRAWKQGFPDFSLSTWIDSVLSTSAGKSLSQHQIDLLQTGACIRILGQFGNAVGNHQQIRVYAVSEKDARKTVEALIETLTKVSGTTGYLKNKRLELQEKIPKDKKLILEKEIKLKSESEKLDMLKKSIYYLSIDEAKEVISQLNKTLDTLNVEIAGFKAKVSAIEKNIEQSKSKKTLSSADTLAKLEEMLTEQTIELVGALARKETATKIRDQATEYYNLNRLEGNIRNELVTLRQVLGDCERELRGIENQLAHPTPDMLPPKLFQNKVTIHPVRTE